MSEKLGGVEPRAVGAGQSEEVPSVACSEAANLARHRALSGIAPIGLLALGRGGEILYANPAASALLKLTAPTDHASPVPLALASQFHETDAFANWTEQLFSAPDATVSEQTVTLRAADDSFSGSARQLRFESSGTVDGAPDEIVLTVSGVDRNGPASSYPAIPTRESVLVWLKSSPIFFLYADPVCVIGNDGFFWHVNTAFSELLGWPEAELLTRPWLDLVHPDDLEATRKASRDKIAGQPVSPVENRYRRRDGSWIWLSWGGFRIPEVNVLFGVARDISERKHAEEALAQSERRFVDAFEHAPLGMALVSVDGRWVRVNRVVCDILGRTPEQLAAIPFSEITHPDDLPAVRERIRQLLAGEQTVFRSEQRYFRADGSVLWAAVHCSLLRDASGQPVHFLVQMRDIEESKRTEAALRASEERFRAIFEQAAVGVAVIETRTARLLSANQRFADILGLPLDHLNGRKISAFTHPDDQPIDEENVRRLQAGEVRSFSREKRYVRPDDSVVWVNITVSALKVSGDTPASHIKIVEDITARKRAESREAARSHVNALIASGAPLARTLETLARDIEAAEPGALCSILLVDAAAKTLRFAAAPSLPAFYNEAVDGVSIGPLAGSCGSAAHSGRRVVTADITTDPLWEPFRELVARANVRSCWSEPIVGATGETLGTFALYRTAPHTPASEEVTLIESAAHLAAIAIERKRADEALLDSENRLSLTFNAVADGLVVQNSDGLILQSNPAAGEILGLTEEQLHGRTSLDPRWQAIRENGDPFPGDEHPAMVTLRTGNPMRDVVMGVRKPDNTLAWIAVNASPLAGDDGEVNMVVCSFSDITRRREMEAEKKRLQTDLLHAQRMDSMGRLAGGVAHDFNNMLGVILGYTEMALRQAEPTEPLFDDLTHIKNAARRSADMTRQLLTYARKQPIQPRVLNLNETVANMLRILQRMIGENIEVLWQPGKPDALVNMDPSQIDQILANLAVNARDAIESHGQLVIKTETVTFARQASHPEARAGAYVLLTVSDNGRGMDDTVLPHIFEPFFTTKPVGEGTGLGCATVYGIVTQNGGFITVDSAVEKGTTFRLYLPRVTRDGLPDDSVPEARREAGHETILVVEDELVLLNLIASVLKTYGYTVLTAATPDEALKLAAEYPGAIDLLLTDVIMPGMNGQALADSLTRARPETRTLFMSGYTADTMKNTGILHTRTSPFLQKPFALADLSRQVRETLDG